MLRRGIRMQLRELMADANNKALKLQRRNIVTLKVLSSSSEEANEILCILICSRRSNNCQQFSICCYLGRELKKMRFGNCCSHGGSFVIPPWGKCYFLIHLCSMDSDEVESGGGAEICGIVCFVAHVDGWNSDSSVVSCE